MIFFDRKHNSALLCYKYRMQTSFSNSSRSLRNRDRLLAITIHNGVVENETLKKLIWQRSIEREEIENKRTPRKGVSNQNFRSTNSECFKMNLIVGARQIANRMVQQILKSLDNWIFYDVDRRSVSVSQQCDEQ